MNKRFMIPDDAPVVGSPNDQNAGGGGKAPVVPPKTTTPPAPTVEGQQKGAEPPPSDPGDGSDLGFTEKQKVYITSLRKESASYRTKSKDLESKHTALENRFSKFETGLKNLFGGEESKLTPEQKLEQLSDHSDAVELKNAILETAVKSGVAGDDYDYFEFLLQKKAEGLKEDEELSDDQIAEVVAQVKNKSKPAEQQKPNTSTSIGTKALVDGQVPPNPVVPGGPQEVTVESFSKMSMTEKSELYSKNQPLYESLLKAAKEGNILV